MPKVKVNRDLADTILNEEDAEEEKKSVEDEEVAKKVSKKKKTVLSSAIFKDGRFEAMFQNPVLAIIFLWLLFVSFCCSISHRIKPILGNLFLVFRTSKSIRNHMNMVSYTLLLLLRNNRLC